MVSDNIDKIVIIVYYGLQELPEHSATGFQQEAYMRSIITVLFAVSAIATAAPAAAQITQPIVVQRDDQQIVLSRDQIVPMSPPRSDDTVAMTREQAERLCSNWQSPASRRERASEDLHRLALALVQMGGVGSYHAIVATTNELVGDVNTNANVTRFCHGITLPVDLPQVYVPGEPID
jgi:hypothetical protein